jgi:hypothetical protein
MLALSVEMDLVIKPVRPNEAPTLDRMIAIGVIAIEKHDLGPRVRVLRDGRNHLMPLESLKALVGEDTWKRIESALG